MPAAMRKEPVVSSEKFELKNNELRIENENSLYSQSDLNALSTESLPSIEEQTQKVDAIKKKRDSLNINIIRFKRSHI